ncbi:mucin-16-like [Neovison vison]|uniref:mucin-16-like n=1 Tax=Neovison vison TaxID=452646 RepID=UPI001CF03D30|nr:mucin-16-like [Neogale vison]
MASFRHNAIYAHLNHFWDQEDEPLISSLSYSGLGYWEICVIIHSHYLTSSREHNARITWGEQGHHISIPPGALTCYDITFSTFPHITSQGHYSTCPCHFTKHTWRAGDQQCVEHKLGTWDKSTLRHAEHNGDHWHIEHDFEHCDKSTFSCVSNISGDSWVSSEASPTTAVLHLPGNTAVTSLGTITSTQESRSSAPVGSETPKGTTAVVTSWLSGDTSLSTPEAGLSETTETEPRSTSSPGLEPWETSTSRHTTMASETMSVPSPVSTGTTAEDSRTHVISSKRTSIPGPAQSTMSPDISTGINTRLSTSSILTKSTTIAMVPKTVVPGTTSQDTSNTDASTTASWAESHSAGTQVSASSEVTIGMDTGSEVVSRKIPASDWDTTSPSPLVPSLAMTSPSLHSPISQARDVTPPVPATSPRTIISRYKGTPPFREHSSDQLGDHHVYTGVLVLCPSRIRDTQRHHCSSILFAHRGRLIFHTSGCSF